MTEKDVFNEIKGIKKLISDLEKKIELKNSKIIYDPEMIYIMSTENDERFMLIGMDRELKSVYGWMSLNNTEEFDCTVFYPSGESAIKSVEEDDEEDCSIVIFDSKVNALLFLMKQT